MRQFTLQVLDLMEALGLESASFEGESLGGWVALDLAINPESGRHCAQHCLGHSAG